MNKDLIDRNELLKTHRETTDLDGSPVSVVTVADINTVPSLGLVPDGSIPVILTKDEIDKITVSLDVMGDRLADREGYSSGEEYWDLIEKLEACIAEIEKPKSLDRIISAAKSQSTVASHKENVPIQEHEPEI